MTDLNPDCLSILLCDMVIEDKRTNKKSLIGTFNDILAATIPASHPCMYLVVSLTNCRHEHDLQIEISRFVPETAEPESLLRLNGKVHAKNPLQVIDLVFELHGLPLKGYGCHTIDLTVLPSGERIGQRSFYVRQMPPSPTPE